MGNRVRDLSGRCIDIYARSGTEEGESGCSYQGYQGRNGDDREDRLEYYIPSLEPALECGISGAQNGRET